MTIEDIKEAIEYAKRWRTVEQPAYQKCLTNLIRVAEAWMELEEWVSKGLVEGSRDPYDCAMYAVEAEMRDLLNPKPKSDLERLREAVKDLPLNKSYSDLVYKADVLDLIDQLEKEKEEINATTND